MAEMAKRHVESFGRIKPVRRNNRRSHESGNGADEDLKAVSLSELFELLASEGHKEGDLLTYSLAKLRLYHKRATERRKKESAAGQLSTMHAVLSALIAVEGNFNLFKENEILLRQVIEGVPSEPPKQADGLSSMKRHLLASGARIAHSPLSK